MQHRIATLEMQLLVKEIVDTACLRAAERVSEKSSDRSSMRSNHSFLKVSLLFLRAHFILVALPAAGEASACGCVVRPYAAVGLLSVTLWTFRFLSRSIEFTPRSPLTTRAT